MDLGYVRDAPLSADRIVSVVSQVLQALSEAHARGFVHRDIKPQNLFISAMPGALGELVKVLDFGVAKMVGGDETTLTATGMAVGSPRYMAPEQIRAMPVGPRTDLYALGGVIYEMLTRRPVFIRDTASDLVMAHVKADPPRPQVGGKHLEGPLVDFMFACLEKLPQDRPASAAAALQMLASMGPDSVRCSDGTPYPPPGARAPTPMPETMQLQTNTETLAMRADGEEPGVGTAPDPNVDPEEPWVFQRVPSAVLRVGGETHDGGERAYASTMESEVDIKPPPEDPLPSDFERVPSLMWQHRGGQPKGRPPGQSTAQISDEDQARAAAAVLMAQKDPMAATTPLDQATVDPELDRGTIPPPDMAMGAGMRAVSQLPPVEKPPSTPAVAFSLGEFERAAAAKMTASKAAASSKDGADTDAGPGEEVSSGARLYVMVGIGAGLIALIAGLVAASL